MRTDLQKEIDRLYGNLHRPGWSRDDCELVAPTTQEINVLKQAQNAAILFHSCQQPNISYGVGDSCGLSVKATEHPAKKIIFRPVYFMGEAARLLNPGKEELEQQGKRALPWTA